MEKQTLTVPAPLAVLALTDEDGVEEVLQRCGRELGEQVEVDLEQLDRLRPEWAQQVEFYVQLCSDFWAAYDAGRRTGPYVAIRREVRSVQQKSTKTEKRDLTGELEALCDVPGLAEVVEELTGPKVDLERVGELGAPFQVTVSQDGAWTTSTLHVEGEHTWPLCLGGPASPGEVRRVLHLRTSQAAWRDRRNRRLAEVRIEVEEIWPDPAE